MNGATITIDEGYICIILLGEWKKPTMKILEYNEVDWRQALELNLFGFDWFLTPDIVKNILNVDRRVPNYYSIYGIEKGEVLGQVGILIDETQTKEGMEKIGYLWCVCTKPSSFRKGVATELIEEIHNRLLAADVRYSFLGTKKSLIAYNLFKKLGYSDFINSNMGFRICGENRHNKTDIIFKTDFEEQMIIKMFSKYSQNLLGFVHRPINFISIRKTWGWMPLDLIGVFWKNDQLIGYVLGDKDGEILKIRELCCATEEDISSCINSLEAELKPKNILFNFISRKSIINNLIQYGFRFFNPTLNVYMIKDLKENQKIDQIQSIYGIGTDKFQMTSIDDY